MHSTAKIQETQHNQFQRAGPALRSTFFALAAGAARFPFLPSLPCIAEGVCSWCVCVRACVSVHCAHPRMTTDD